MDPELAESAAPQVVHDPWEGYCAAWFAILVLGKPWRVWAFGKSPRMLDMMDWAPASGCTAYPVFHACPLTQCQNQLDRPGKGEDKAAGSWTKNIDGIP